MPEHLDEGDQVDDGPHSRPRGALNITDLNVYYIYRGEVGTKHVSFCDSCSHIMLTFFFVCPVSLVTSSLSTSDSLAWDELKFV